MKKFKEFNQNLSNDIIALSKTEKGDYEPITNVDIIQILDVVKDPIEIKKIDDTLKENFMLDTSLTVTNVKRGDKLYLTALLQKTSNNQTVSSQDFGVICVRVVEIYKGISRLSGMMKK